MNILYPVAITGKPVNPKFNTCIIYATILMVLVRVLTLELFMVYDFIMKNLIRIYLLVS